MKNLLTFTEQKKLAAMFIAAGEVPANTSSHILLAMMPALRDVCAKVLKVENDPWKARKHLQSILEDLQPAMFFKGHVVDLPQELQKESMPPIYKAFFVYKGNGRRLQFLWSERSVALLGIASFCAIAEANETAPIYFNDPSFADTLGENDVTRFVIPEGYDKALEPKHRSWRVTYNDKQSLGPTYYISGEEVLSVFRAGYYLTRKPDAKIEAYLYDKEAVQDRWVNLSHLVPATRYKLTVRMIGEENEEYCYFYSQKVLDKYKSFLNELDYHIEQHDFFETMQFTAEIVESPSSDQDYYIKEATKQGY